MDIRYTVLSPFKIDFLKIKCADFKNKKELFQNELNKFKEKRLPNFYSNKKNYVVLKLIVFLILLPFLMHPVFAQSDYYKVIPSDIGTLNVGITTIPVFILVKEATELAIESAALPKDTR